MDLFKLENTSVSGNPVVLEDCGKAPLQGLTVYGKSTQVTTTGAQLFVSEKSHTYSVPLLSRLMIWQGFFCFYLYLQGESIAHFVCVHLLL